MIRLIINPNILSTKKKYCRSVKAINTNKYIKKSYTSNFDLVFSLILF